LLILSSTAFGCTASSAAYEGGERMLRDESGRIGYLVLYLMGAPIGLLLLLWVIFGNNLIGRG
jgi:hypothetical protein